MGASATSLRITGAPIAGQPVAAGTGVNPIHHQDVNTADARTDITLVPPQTPRQAAAADPQDEVRQRFIAAFVDYARTRVNLPASANSETVTAAFLTSRTGSHAVERWLEGDSELMLRLAQASDLFRGEPTAGELSPGHRRLLANSLVLALTHTIDWGTALNPDASDGTAVFYDGITLRNAAHLSIEEAAAAIDKRISQALDAVPATKALTATIPQLRLALIGDPTLTLTSLPKSVRYGSRDWAKLWTGIETCVAAGLNPATLPYEEVAAFGQAISMTAAEPPRQHGPGQAESQTSPPTALHNAVLLMAHAAGVVDLRLLQNGNQAEMTKKIQAFAAEEFKSEIALAEATVRLLSAQQPPTARGIAEEALKDRGLDPMAIVIEEPISSKGKRTSYKLHDFYVKFNDLSEIESNRFNRELIEKIGNGAALYKDVYNRKFDTYVSNHIDAYTKVIRIVVDMARNDGFKEDGKDATISIDRIVIKPHDDIQAHGFVVSCTDKQHSYSYIFSSSGVVERIPDGMSREAWLIGNRDTVLAKEDLEKIQARGKANGVFSISLERQVSAPSDRLDNDIATQLRAKLLELKTQEEPIQDGVSKADRMLEFIVPFYRTYASIKRGEYVAAYVAFLFDVGALIPAALAAGKLIAVSKKSLMLGIQVAVGSIPRRGLLKGTMLGVKHAGAGLPQIGLHAMHSVGTALDAFVPIPAGTRSLGQVFASSYRHFSPAALRKAAANIGGKFPRLAAQLRARVAMRRTLHGQSMLITNQGVRAPIGRVIHDIRPSTARFVQVLADDGNTQWLRRLGNGYTQFEPHRLESVGPVFLRGNTDRLYPSLQVSELGRHSITDIALLEKLRNTPAGNDGTIAVDGKTFARIADAYIEIVPDVAAGVDGGKTWRTPIAGDMAGIADLQTPLTYDAGKGGWISPARHHDAAGLGPVLHRWALANHTRTLSKARAISLIRERALTLYGERYADFLKARGPALLDDLTAMDKPVDVACALLGDARFLHAMLTPDDTHADRIVRVLAMHRQSIFTGDNVPMDIAKVRARAARYFGDILRDLNPDELQQLRDVLDAHGDRAIALMNHARTGNTAQQHKADGIVGMIDTLREAVSARSISVMDGAGETGIRRIAATPAPPITPDEYHVLEDLGLAPKPISQATLDEISSALGQPEAAYEEAVTPGQALREMCDIQVPAQAMTHYLLLDPDMYRSNALSRATLIHYAASDSGVLLRFKNGHELTFSNEAAANGELRGQALLDAAKTLDFTSIADLIRRGGQARLDTARAAMLEQLDGSLRKLNPANAEESRLLYRSLLQDERLSINGQSMAALAGKYGIDADDIAAHMHRRPSALWPVSAAPLSGLGEAGLSAYRTPQPRDAVLLAGELPLFHEAVRNRLFIKQGGDWFQVRWDGDNATWRIVQSDKPTAPGVPVRRSGTRWTVHNAAAIPGGQLTVRRQINWAAADKADVDIPADIKSGRKIYHDRSGVPYVPQGKISQTETVVRASRILELTTDVTPRVPWGEAFSDYFNVLVDNGKTPALVAPNPELRNAGGEVGMNQTVLEDTKDLFVKLTKSATFQGLLNRAVGEARLGTAANHRWTIRVMLPGADASHAGRIPVDFQQLTVSIPYLRNPANKQPFYMSKGGQLVPMSTRRAIVRNYVTMLTDEISPSLAPWSRQGRLDPHTFNTLGLGERGALDYLAERIMREIESPMPALLSHLPLDESHASFVQTTSGNQGGRASRVTLRWNDKTKQAIDEAGGFPSLERYVALQDKYLDGVFPLGQSGAVAIPSRAASVAHAPAVSGPRLAADPAASLRAPQSSSVTAIHEPVPSQPPAASRARPQDLAHLQAPDTPVPDPYAGSARSGETVSMSATETVTVTERILDQPTSNSVAPTLAPASPSMPTLTPVSPSIPTLTPVSPPIPMWTDPLVPVELASRSTVSRGAAATGTASVTLQRPRLADQQAVTAAHVPAARNIFFSHVPGAFKTIPRTATVKNAIRALEPAKNLAFDTSWDHFFDLRLNVNVSDVRTSYFARTPASYLHTEDGKRNFDQITAQRVRDTFLDLYRHSETFRGLANGAITNDGSLSNHRWTLQVMLPHRFEGPLAVYNKPFEVQSARHLVQIPILAPAEHIFGEYYLSWSGQVFAQQTRRIIVENFVRMLGRGRGLRLSVPHAAGQVGRIDPRTFGERGAAGYIADRIMGEMGGDHPEWRLPPRLSPIRFDETQVILAPRTNGAGTDTTRGRLNAAAMQAVEDAGGLQDLETHWNLQNAHLDALYPPQRTAVRANPPIEQPGPSRRRPANAPAGAVPARRPRPDAPGSDIGYGASRP
jgi:hypothetical protein